MLAEWVEVFAFDETSIRASAAFRCLMVCQSDGKNYHFRIPMEFAFRFSCNVH